MGRVLPWRKEVPPLPASIELVEKITATVKEPELWKDFGDDWQIGLRPKWDKLKIDDPIDIEIATRNRSDTPLARLAYSFQSHPHYPAMVAELTTPDGKTHRLRRETHDFRHADFPRPYTVEAGNSLIETVSIDQWRPVDGGRWDLFSEAGEYRLRFRFAGDRCKRLGAEWDDYSDH